MTDAPRAGDAGDVSRFRERRLTLLTFDLAGYTRATTSMQALDVALLLDAYYELVLPPIREAGGRLVKFMGDGAFAVFPEERCAEAIDATVALVRTIDGWPRARAAGLGGGANIHLATVAEGELGPPDGRRYDVVGAGVNHLFRMGGGRGVRISEPAYRQLPDARRGPWHKLNPPATYVFGA